MALAEHAGLLTLADTHLSAPTDKGSNAGRKIGSLVAGMIAGADSITDLHRIRHGAMDIVFDRPDAPSTLESFLREFTFGHVRQLGCRRIAAAVRTRRTHIRRRGPAHRASARRHP